MQARFAGHTQQQPLTRQPATPPSPVLGLTQLPNAQSPAAAKETASLDSTLQEVPLQGDKAIGPAQNIADIPDNVPCVNGVQDDLGLYDTGDDGYPYQ